MKNRVWNNPIWLALLLTAVSVFAQIKILPMFWADGERLKAMYGLSIVWVVAFFVMLIWCALIKEKGCVPRSGETSIVVGAASLLSGLGLMVSEGQEMKAWLVDGTITEYNKQFLGVQPEWLLTLKIVFGVLGGFALVLLGACWLFGKSSNQGIIHFSMLFPALWMVARLMCFNQSFVSSLRNPYTFLTSMVLVSEAMFLFMLARAHFGSSKTKIGVFAAGCVFIGGMMGVGYYAAQWVLMRQNEAFAAMQTNMIGFEDLLIGIFALIVLAYVFSAKGVECRENALDLVRQKIQQEKAAEAAFVKTPDVASAETVPNENAEQELLNPDFDEEVSKQETEVPETAIFEDFSESEE